jgi:hypothetical protein
VVAAYVLTSDIDWASDDCIEHFLGIAARFRVRPTLFVTHPSEAVRRAAAEGRADLGAHPNFTPETTQGESVEAVIDYVRALAPDAVAVRCHRHFAGADIEAALARRGYQLDSNTCRLMEHGIAAETLPSGMIRLPVFFEDDLHWDAGLSWRFADHAEAFFSPGLKILNFHPFFVALNAPDADFYARHKPKITSLSTGEAAKLRHGGKGAETFLVEALAAIQDAGHRFVTLGELRTSLRQRGSSESTLPHHEGVAVG